MLHERVAAIDPEQRSLRLENGQVVDWDRLIVAHGVDFDWEESPGMDMPQAQEKIMHVWQAGPQSVQLRQQLEAMPDGGRFIIRVAVVPFRCPPARYERARAVASY